MATRGGVRVEELSGRLPEEAVSEATMAPLLEAFRAWHRG